MKWIDKHLNWTYGIALIIGVATLTIWGFIVNSAIGYVVYMVITIVGGELVLWRKNRLFEYPVLILFPPIFAIVTLCLGNKRQEMPEQTDTHS
jgi:hypothetical protein